jgi:hypothetical protein
LEPEGAILDIRDICIIYFSYALFTMVPWEFEIPQTCGMEHFQGVPLELKKGEFA